jgi:hypothetical protein
MQRNCSSKLYVQHLILTWHALHCFCTVLQVTSWPDAGKSILVFSVDHCVFDQLTAHKFLQLWLEQAATAEATAAAGVEACQALGTASPAAAAAAATDADAVQVDSSMFDRSCYSSMQWQLPQSKKECRQWLAEHSGNKCPFPVRQTHAGHPQYIAVGNLLQQQ